MPRLTDLAAATLPLLLASAAILPDKTLLVPLQRIQNQTQYGSTLSVGTPPQRNVLITDTGSMESPGYSVASSTACQDNRCADYGTYDNTTSSTSAWVNDAYGAPIGPDPAGSTLRDSVQFGNATVKNVTVGTERTFSNPRFQFVGPQAGIYGLGNACSDAACNDFANVPQQLYELGATASRFFGLYLGPADADAAGHVLFGGMDRAKMAGAPITVPMVLTADSGNQTNMVRSLRQETTIAGSTQSFDVPADQQVGLLDSGSHDWSFGQEQFDVVASYFGLNATEASDSEGPYAVNCKYRDADPADKITVVFGGVDASAPEVGSVDVPLALLPTMYESGTCAVDIAPYGYGVLSAQFLRAVYAGYDVDNLRIMLSPVVYTDDEDIVAV